MNLKKMRLAAMVTTVLVSALTSASIIAAGGGKTDGIKGALPDEEFAKMATITKADPALVGKPADKSAVTGPAGLDAFLGADAQLVKKPRFGFVRMIEVKYSNTANQALVAQLLQFRNNKLAEAYFVDSIPAGAKVRKTGATYLKGKMQVTRVGSVVIRINSASGVKASNLLAKRYKAKIAKRFSKIKHPAYRVLQTSKSVALMASAGLLKESSQTIDKGRRPEVLDGLSYTNDYVSVVRGGKANLVVFAADFDAWSKRVSGKKLTSEQSAVVKFAKGYVNRFRYFPVKGGGYTIVGRYKGYVLGIYRGKGSAADPKRMKTVLENTRIKLFFGKGSTAAKGSAPAAGAATDDSDEGESTTEESADSGDDEESEEGGAASESDAADSDE